MQKERKSNGKSQNCATNSNFWFKKTELINLRARPSFLSYKSLKKSLNAVKQTLKISGAALILYCLEQQNTKL